MRFKESLKYGATFDPFCSAMAGTGEGTGSIGTTTGAGEGAGAGEGTGEGVGAGGDKSTKGVKDAVPPKFNISEIIAHPDTKQVLTDWAEREIANPLKTKNSELLGKLTKYKVKNDKGEEEYMDPEEALMAIESYRKGTPVEVEKEVERALKTANDRHDAAIKIVKDQLEDSKVKIKNSDERRKKLLLDNTLSNALSNSGIKEGKKHLHENYLRTILSIIEDGGVEKVAIMDDDKPRYGAHGLMPIEEFLETYRNQEGVAEDWKPDLRGGSGTGPNSSRSGGISVDTKLPPAERMKALRRSGG